MPSQVRSRLSKLEDKEKLLGRRQGRLAYAESKCCSNCFVICRPFQILFGVIFFLLAMLIAVSLVITRHV